MKRQNLLAAVLMILTTGLGLTSSAQKKASMATTFKKGSATVNLGVGTGVDYRGDYRFYNSSNRFGTKAALEFGIWQAGPGVITLGAEAGATFSSGGRNGYRSHVVVVAGRSAWHCGWNVRGLDTYGGVSAGAGFRHYDFKNSNDPEVDDVIPVFGGFVGASYFFTKKFGVNVEAGYDITNLQAGVVFKLR